MAGGESVAKPWLEGGEVVNIGAAEKPASYEPRRFKPDRGKPVGGEVEYLGNESKLVPAGLLGYPVETTANIMKLVQAGIGAPVTALTGKTPEALNTDWEPVGGVGTFARLLGYKPMAAPGEGTEMTGDVMKGAASGGALAGLPGAAAGGISGFGQYLMRKMFPGSVPAEIMGGMAGGAVAPAMAARRAELLKNLTTAEGQNAIINKNLPAVKGAVEQKVVKDMAAELNLEPMAAANIAESQKLAAAVPGTTLDIGQQSQAGATVQRAKNAFRFSPQAVAEKQAADEANRGALAAAIPKTEAAEVPFSRLLGEQQKRLEVLSSDAAQAGETAKTASAPKIQTPQELADAGVKLRGIRQTEKVEADKEASRRSAMVDQAAGDARFPLAGVVSEAERVLGQPILKFDASNAPKVVQAIQGILTKSQGPQEPRILGPDGQPIGGGTPAAPPAVGIKDLRAMREAVNQDIADVSSSPSGVDRRQFRALTQIKGAIDDAVEASGNPQAAKAFREFNDYYAKEYAPRFLRGENLKQTFKTPLGVDAIADENLIGQYLKPGSTAPMRRYTQLYGENPQAMKIMEDAIFDRYAKDVIKNGVVDDKAHSKFMFNYGAQMKQMGERGANLQRELNDKASVVRTSLERQASLEDSMQTVKSDAFVNSLKDKFGARSVDSVMGDAVRDPRMASTLISRMSSGEAKGLVNWFADDIGNRLRDAPYGKMGESVSAKLTDKNYSAAYRMALDKAFGKDVAAEHIKRLDAIQKLASRMDATELDPFIGLKGDAAGVNQDSLAKTAGFTARTAFNMIRAVVTGRTSAEDVAFTLGSQFAGHKLQGIANEATRKILTDPEMSQAVLDAMKNPQKSKPWTESAATIAKKIPGAVGYWMGADRYPEMVGKTAGALINPLVKEKADEGAQ